MIDLDDEKALKAADPGGMLDAVARLGGDCRAGYEAGLKTTGLPSADGVASISLSGMGGSAVSGDIVKALYAGRLGVAIDVVRSPLLPEHAGPHGLVVTTSYSGNTAETLTGFDEALRRGCRVLAVTSGGELARRAEDADVPVVKVPTGMQPRAALGHLALATLGALEAMGAIPSVSNDVDEAAGVLEGLAGELGPANAGSRAKAIARRMLGRVPVIWGTDGIGSVAAMRWKTQMNENAKSPAFWSAMSELDHNELAGWGEGTGSSFFVVALRHPEEPDGIAPRYPFSLGVVKDAGADTEEIEAVGDSALARLLSLITVGDFTSVYSALLRGVDPTPVDVIEGLKKHLAGE